jgi:NADH-quinone oxidoreductase subunit N
MNTADFQALLPLLVVAATSVAVMLVIAVRRSHLLTVATTLLGLAIALATIIVAQSQIPRAVTSLLIIDGYALFFIGLILTTCVAVVIFSYGYFSKQPGPSEELYVLILLATVGSVVLVSSCHFASFFLGLETLSVSLYSLIAYPRLREASIEAGIKYLILAACSAAFLLFGTALIYAESGTMELGRIAAWSQTDAGHGSVFFVPGLVFVIVGIGFKLGVVPFHMWVPDVYQGAPAPVTAYIATISKGATVAFLLRFFYQFLGSAETESFHLVMSIIATTSMVAGNLLALLQNNVKRLLAYSSIAHLGYLLVAFEAGGIPGISAAVFYLVAYFITTIGAFGIVTVLSGSKREADALDDYRGLFWRRPVLAGVFTAMVFSLSSIPLTAGFIGKFYIVAAGASSHLWTLVITLVIASVIGLFYYFRLVVVLYDQTALKQKPPLTVSSVSWAEGFVLIALTALLIWFGVYPMPLIKLITLAVGTLV